VNLPVRVRLTLWYSAVLLVILGVVGVFLVARLRAGLVRGVDDDLAARSQVVAQGVRPGPRLPSLGLQEIVAQLVAGDGRVLSVAGESVPSYPLLQGPGRGVEHFAGADYRVLGTRLPGGTTLVVGRELDEVQHAVRGLILLLLASTPIALALGGGGGWLLARAALRPVDVMTKMAAAVDPHRDHEPIPVPDPDDELSRLARTLNDMLGRLHDALEQERRFSADASHELRTPLGIMGAELDVALRSKSTPDAARPTLSSLREEVATLTRVVENLFLLARMDQQQAAVVDRQYADLLELTTRVAARFATKASDRGVELTVEGVAAAARVDTDLMSLVLSNLVDNALEYTGRGGSVRMTVGQNGSAATVSVADTGIGIAPEQLAHIFDRFYRADRARSRKTGGAGLGLAIVQRLVEAHDGSIEVSSRPGQGSTFVVHIG